MAGGHHRGDFPGLVCSVWVWNPDPNHGTVHDAGAKKRTVYPMIWEARNGLM